MTEPGNAGAAGAGAAGGADGGAIPEETLKRAMHAFKKRLKLTKLDQESKLGARRPMTSGKKSDVMGIIPPNDFPRAVWAELARTKQLKDMGGGFYSLP
ncbi:MAG: hypothetical protein KF912_06625 [Phycisphaeraceae bacterium]|nr:hypothetical protein [Phycisphaeraceae bacterium]MBX3366973.1 hypothetical protein [Phycisphaeraceae bacterium]